MNKKIFTLVIAIVLVTITGCGKKETVKKEEMLKLELKNNIKATAKITKNIDDDIVRIKFKRQNEGSEVKTKLIYYYNKKEVYSEDLKYIFPNGETECILEMVVKHETLKLKQGADLTSYTDSDIEKTKLNYDSLKLIISK